MSQRFIYSEQVDRYLKDKLSESERSAFEEQMQQDPLLQSEMKLQREIFQALGETRKAHIKARLDQVPVEQSPWIVGSPFKMAAIVSALVITSAVTYVTLNPSESEVFNEVDITGAITTGEFFSSTEQPTQAPAPTVTPELESEPTVDIPAPDESTLVADARQSASKETSRKIPSVRRPAVASTFSEDAVQLDYSDFEMPQKQALQANTVSESTISVERVLDEVYPFHYQFYDDKLFLHGDFAEEPYKIIALNTEKDRSLFLEYGGNYFLLEEQSEVSPLIMIRDTTLVKELRRLSTTD